MPTQNIERPLRAVAARSVGAAALLGLLTVSVAQADPAPPYPRLLAQSHGAPRLAEADAGVAQATGLANQAGMRPNPTVSLEVENFAGTGPVKGLGGAEATASVEQTFELGDKRAARVAAGRAGVEAAEARRRQARADFAFDLAEAYAQAEASERRVALATEALSLAEDDARVAEALVNAGKEAELRVVQARAAVAAARADLDEARAARATAFARLTALSGSPAPLTSIPVSLLDHASRAEDFSPPDPLQSPAYLAALADREATARRVKVERTRATPDLTVSVGARRLAGDDATALVAGASIPFPLFDRNRGNVAAAEGELAGADARLDAARRDAEAEAHAALVRADAAQSRVRAADEAVAAAEETYRLTRIGYEGGKISLVEVLNARRALSEARNLSINARLERVSAEASLARLRGEAPFGDL